MSSLIDEKNNELLNLKHIGGGIFSLRKTKCTKKRYKYDD